MELTTEQQNAIARLYENESLTDNLDDADARIVLQWAQEQIIAHNDGELVQAAVNSANQSGAQGAQALVAQANTFLAQGLEARAQNSIAPNAVQAPTINQNDDAANTAPREQPPTDLSGSPAPPPAATRNQNSNRKSKRRKKK